MNTTHKLILAALCSLSGTHSVASLTPDTDTAVILIGALVSLDNLPKRYRNLETAIKRTVRNVSREKTICDKVDDKLDDINETFMLVVDQVTEGKEHFSKKEMEKAVGKGLVAAAATFTVFTIISSLRK